jgi:hypothetical protein
VSKIYEKVKKVYLRAERTWWPHHCRNGGVITYVVLNWVSNSHTSSIDGIAKAISIDALKLNVMSHKKW